MDIQATYEYTALTGSDSLRLALLEPSPTVSAPLQCSLVSTTLRDCWEDILENYITLSYVWGNESDTADISVKGKRLTITASLDSALRHIRDQKRMVRIWADGISINQADVAERNQQVQQMAAIYKIAKSTIVFLGESTPEPTAIFKALPSVSIAFADRSRLVNWHISPDSKSPPQREAIERHILTKPWFYRVWILQEFVLSQDPWIQCGQLRVRWDVFWFHLGYPKLLLELHDDDNLMGGTSPRVANILYPTETQFSPGYIFEEHKRVVRASKMEDRARDNFIGMVATREKFDVSRGTELPSKDGIIGPWHTLLRLSRGFGVSDPRDLIYGHLGIIS